MARHPFFERLLSAARVARFADERGLDTTTALGMASEERERNRAATRRTFLTGATAAAAALLVNDALAGPKPKPAAKKSVAIVGAGLAGLACADALATKGVVATVFEANGRAGGRCWSERSLFPGQTVERGGELVDNLHKTMLGYAGRFGLDVEDVNKAPGELTYYFFGQHHSEAEVVDQYRVLVPRMRADLKGASSEPSALSFNAWDLELDALSLGDWLDTRAADLPLIREVVRVAYEGEYGLSSYEQSSLNFLLFIHADRRAKFAPFGVFSDERYHLVDGNDGVVAGLAAALPAPIQFGHALTRLSRNAAGTFVLEFAGKPTQTFDRVVLTVPFSVLRASVTLDASLGLSTAKKNAIATLGYGDNAKTMIGFDSRPWATAGGNGAAYTDEPGVQVVWETNPTNAGPGGVLTDYSSAERGANLTSQPLQAQIDTLLAGTEAFWPGMTAAASRPAGPGSPVRALREHWPSNPRALGSYTCYRPGQFTTVAGLEGQPAGNLYFAGEHADSFYSWQGFMEGACISGLTASAAVLASMTAA